MRKLLFCPFNPASISRHPGPELHSAGLKRHGQTERETQPDRQLRETDRQRQRPESKRPQGLFLSLVECDESGRQPIRHDDEPTGE